MTAHEQKKAIEDRTVNGVGFVQFDKMRIKVKVLDARKSFGRDDVLITPVAGDGEQWVDLTRVFSN